MPTAWAFWTIGLISVVLICWIALRLRAVRRQAREAQALAARRAEELRAKQLELEQQNQRLELNNQIVKIINAQVDFQELLKTILESAIFLLSAHRALAFVRHDHPVRYEVDASSGWRRQAPTSIALRRDEIEQAYLGQARQIANGIWIGLPGDGRLFQEEKRLGIESKALLALRIDLDGEAVGFVISSHVRDEDAFDHHEVQSLEDLRDHLASAFVKGRMMEELRLLNQKKNEFLGIAAHDLRSPLGGMVSYIDLLLRFLDEGKTDQALWRRFLGNVRTTADDMRELVEDLLDVSSIELGKLELQIACVSLADLLIERADLHSRAAQEKGIELRVEIDSSASEVMIDRGKVAQVLDNLVSNAIKFTDSGGRVRVWCEEIDGEVVTQVQDTGQGLAEEELADLFTGKKLSARPTGGEKSTGFGLLIVKKIVEQHGGRAWAASELGEGSTFSFSLPSAVKEEEDGEGAGVGLERTMAES